MRFRFRSTARQTDSELQHWESPGRKSSPEERAGSVAGVPSFLNASFDTALHQSPPVSGVGSRSEPVAEGRGSVQPVAAMRADTYYRSPVNPTNPVVVWTDGAHLFFAPAEQQGDAAPEAAFSAPPGYTAEEIHWDRVEGLTTGGGALVVIARKPGEDDLEVAITNRLAQKYNLAKGNVGAQVAREGGEFTRSDDTSVSLEFSEARSRGDIHSVAFSEGFFRYRAAGGSHDLYVARGANPAAYLVERSTGSIARTFDAGAIAAVVPDSGGVIRLELSSGSTVSLDLRRSPPTVTSKPGQDTAEAGYSAARKRVEALGIALTENGVRLRVNELEMIEQALAAGANRGLNALARLRSLNGGSSGDPVLEVTKSIGPDNAYGLAEAGEGTPGLYVYQPFEPAPSEAAATIRHEMTHIIMGAIEAVNRAGLSASARADLEGAMRFEAGRARDKARAGLLRAGEYGAGDPVPVPGTRSEWRSRVGNDVELADVWVELLRRYSFISDPEGTRELRGASLADESRYLGTSETTGHPADSVGEFVASFVTCATLFRAPFVDAVLAAASSATESGGSYLKSLYRRAWKRVDAIYVPLGRNPF